MPPKKPQEEKQASNTFSLTAFSVLGFIVGLVGGSLLSNILDRIFTDGLQSILSTSLVILLLAIILFLIGHMLYDLTRKLSSFEETANRHLNSLQGRVGIEVKYFDRQRHGLASVYREARQVIEKADKYILVLTSYIAEVGDDGNDEDLLKERNSYYNEIINRAMAGVTYKRILQIPEGQSLSSIIETEEGYRKHFRKILEVRPNLKIGFFRASAKRPTTFVIVDGKLLVWQINELLPNGKTRMHGIFVFDDPRGEIIQHFEAYFDSVAYDGHTASIDPSELTNF